MGETRFDVWALWRCSLVPHLCLHALTPPSLPAQALWLMRAQRQYAGGLRFKPKGSEAWRTLEAPFFSVRACNTRWLTTSTQLNWA